MSISRQTGPVTTVDEAYDACQPDVPLHPGDPRCVDLTPVRGGFNLARIVAKRIVRTRSSFHQQLIIGHRGCGKSTELKQLQAGLQDEGFLAVYRDLEGLLDLGDTQYLDVLLWIARAVYEELLEHNIELRQPLVEDLDRWFAETILTREQQRDVVTTLEAEFGVKPDVPLLLRFLAAATGLIRAGGPRRGEVRTILEREVRVFLQRLNELLDDAQTSLARAGSKGLAVIVDGLEKMQYQTLPDGQSSHSVLFDEHAEQLKAPHCHVVYTVPVSLVFNVNLSNAFAEVDVIPMVKLTERDGVTPSRKGRQALVDVVARRIAVKSVFDTAGTVRTLVEASGGSVRDLLRLVRFACDDAEDCITQAHGKIAVLRLAREYDFLVRDEHLGQLTQIARQRRVPGDELSAWLLHHRLVLEYQNGERWADLHPVVRSNSRVQERLADMGEHGEERSRETS